MLMSTTWIRSASISAVDNKVFSDEAKDKNPTKFYSINELQSLSNETTYSNSSSNGTAYQCQGPTKDEMKLYEILDWWMDAVCQVMKIHV